MWRGFGDLRGVPSLCAWGVSHLCSCGWSYCLLHKEEVKGGRGRRKEEEEEGGKEEEVVGGVSFSARLYLCT